MDNSFLLTPTNVGEFLNDFIERLASDDVERTLYTVGGVALALVDENRRATNDVDGWLRESALSDIDTSALREKWNLSDKWFDEGVKQFLPALLSPPEMFDHHTTRGGVTVITAKPEVLLAMKLKASRGKDQGDISFLVRHLNITSLDEAEAILEWCFPGDALTDKAIMRLGLAFDELT